MQQQNMHRLDDAALKAWPLPQPDEDGDKETRGRVIIVAGSREVPGAAILAAEGALRAGAGKVLVATVEEVAMHLAIAVPELRVIGLRSTRAGEIDPAGVAPLLELADQTGVLLIGPGLQDDDASRELFDALRAAYADVPTILDAAAITATSSRPHERHPVLITPHAGEMAHLSGASKESIQDDSVGTALDAARRWNAVVALKGSTTVLADPDGTTWKHDEGAIGLATAGSGDVLAGIIAGFVARGASLAQATAWGIVVHGLAGTRLCRRLGKLGFLARELPGEVPALLDALST